MTRVDRRARVTRRSRFIECSSAPVGARTERIVLDVGADDRDDSGSPRDHHWRYPSADVAKRTHRHGVSFETVGARCSVAGLFGVIAGIVAALFVTWPAAILVGWDAASVCYLAWTWKIVGWSGRRRDETPRASRRRQPAHGGGNRPGGRGGAAGCRRPRPDQGRAIPRRHQGLSHHDRDRQRHALVGDHPHGLHASLHQVSTIKARTVQSTSTRRTRRRTSTLPTSPLRSG